MTGYQNIARRFFAEQRFEHVVLLRWGSGAALLCRGLSPAARSAALPVPCHQKAPAAPPPRRLRPRPDPPQPARPSLPDLHCSADGALEAAPAMGSADIILDLVRK